jgi:alanyl-tRNA synthetase
VTLSHCHVESSQAAGVEVRGRATVLLHCCRVHRSLRSGVFVTAFGELHIEWSNLFGNAFAALECAGGKGGGKAGRAQGAARDAANAAEAAEAAKKYVAEKLG